MSESIARKVQPFTIGTKLSAPAVPKSPDFTPQSFHLRPLHHHPQHRLRHQHHQSTNKSLDNRTPASCNLNDNAPLYLSLSQGSQASQAGHGPLTVSVLPPTVRQTGSLKQAVVLAVAVQPAVVDMAEEDQLNQNVLGATTTTTTTTAATGSATSTTSTTAVSRSIKKITISGSRESSLESQAASRLLAQGSGKPSPGQNTNNNNNNNKITATAGAEAPLPAIVGVSCENKPGSHFKVLLRKDRVAEAQTVKEQTTLQVKSDSAALQVTSVPRPRSPRSEFKRGESQQRQPPSLHSNGPLPVVSHSDCFTQRNALFNQEILQAEAWIKRKLQELHGGPAGQCCPLEGSEEASNTLHRDLKDFENTLTPLNQTGEQLICKLNPSAELVRRQLSQLREHWQTLRQTVANQARAPGGVGVRSLQEFNRKVERLEAWIRDKEAEQSLSNILAENVDKMQLTRRILDLKQEELLQSTLHQEINQLASRLEKQGKSDGRHVSSTRKNINKMWLKVQAYLKTYHEDLQLALEASSLYHQADSILSAIHNVRRSPRGRGDTESHGDREIRDIASQIMMLNVNVSQLSNLHPALAPGVSQKQSEVKESWAALQRALRSDRSAPPPSASAFTREEDDPVTPGREPHRVMGTEPKRIMGKEGKEERIRLKSCATTSDSRSSKRTPSSPGGEPRPTSHAPSAPGDAPARQDDVMLRRRSAGERKPRVVEQGAMPPLRAHPQLQVQLQKFTVSADKTLSWLKENVGLATQVCSVVGQDGLEAARRCQEALEKEILSNGTRIEVVKKEGRGLIRAQHPGSEKIETFLGQLEFLWEELRRRHQRNAGFLQASEELGFRALRALRGLSGLEAWLEEVELTLSHEASVAGDPHSMSVAERESRLLEREVSARGLELDALRQEVERLGEGRGPDHDHDHGHDHDHAHDRAHGGLPGRLAAVERKYQQVQSALTQQSSELQDTRMLTEFLERVELEESQDPGQHRLAQPLHSDITSDPSPLALPGGGLGGPLIESLDDPVGELREAVEMLNDTVRQRGRTQSHDQAVRSLFSKHARVAVRVEECLCCSKELNMDVLERETDMAVRCEPERCGLEELEEQQDQLEIDYEVIREEVEDMGREASRLEQLCPERLQVPGGSRIQNTLQAWKELESSIMENRSRLQEFIQLKYFFRSYLAMISWTEDTRACIFSDTALNLGRDGQEPVATELDRQIEQKFQEFDELASAGVNLLHREHHLTEMVKERMEELRSMLGWISVHWRAQKQQWLDRLKREEGSQDNIYCEAAMGSPLTESSTPRPEVYQCLRPLGASPREDTQTPRPDSQPASPASRPAQRPDPGQEDDYEVMTRVGGRPGGEAATPTVLVLKEPGGAALGSTVNLLLSLRSTGDSQVQVLEPPAGLEEELQEEASEPVHRVSAYLHVKDSGVALTPVYESITLPRLKAYASSQAAAPSCSSSSPSSSTSSSTSSCSPLATQAPGACLHPTARGGASMFSSLKRMGQKRKRKRDARRHTIQRIMGGDERAEAEPRYASEGVAYDTHTWPLKEGRRKKPGAVKSPVRVGGRGRGGDGGGGGGEEDTAYMKNPLLMDIDSECSGEYSITPYAVCGGPQVRSHCRFLSLGSVLSFELPKDMSVIPSIQDIITIAPPECRRAAGADPERQRPRSLSSFKHTPPTPHSPRVYPGYPEVVVKDTPDAGGTTPRHPHPHHPRPPFPGEVADQTVPGTDLRGASGPGSQEDPETEWDKMSELQVSPSADADYVVMEGSGRLRQLSAGSGPHSNPARGDGASNVNAVLVAAAAAPSVPRGRHECLSVHTLIQHLDKHQYHRAAGLQGEERQPAQVQSQASHMVVNLKAAVGVGGLNDSLDSGVSSTGSARLCAEAPCPDVVPRPRAVVRRLVSLELEGLDCKLARVTSSQASVEPPPPLSPRAPNEAEGELEAGVEVEGEPFRTDHRQFEEEEEELEDIWNRTRSYRQSICSDIMYQPHQEEDEAPAAPCHQGEPPLDTPLAPAAKPQAVLYRKLVTASAPNLLVAEFKLPPSIQSLLGYDREKPAGEGLPLVAKGERRSWACESSSSVVNERTSDAVKGADVVDTQRYVYRYGDEEEEEVEEDAEVAKKGEEGEQVKEDTACLQEQSVSLLSVLRNSEGASRIGTTLESSGEMENQDPRMATGGRCRTTSGKAELQSMEGTLERKHKLQLGGKKAASRGWNSHHAVLYRHSLCFYQDRKDTLRSSVCGLPLNLVGAECEPVPDYTKKPNVLCLRLRDGSEYLLNASSRFMMRKWMLKIQANTGPTNSAPSVSPGPVNQDLPVSPSRSLCAGCQGTGRCHCSSRPDLISTFPRRKDRSPPQAKEIVVLTREYSPMTQGGQRIAEEQLRAVAPAEADPCGDDEDDDDDDAVVGLRSLSGGSPGNSPPSSSPHCPGAAEQGWLQNKCRSHSFTSATYQKIRPVRKLTPAVGGGGELGSSYSVTLVIGDRSSGDQGGPPASGGPEPPVMLGTAGWTHRAPPGEDSAPWSYASLPRPPRNKSVFKKIFGKKEGHV